MRETVESPLQRNIERLLRVRKRITSLGDIGVALSELSSAVGSLRAQVRTEGGKTRSSLRHIVGELRYLRHQVAYNRAALESLVESPGELYCPVCESDVDLFLPWGRHPRPHASCPRCGALERHRLSVVYLQGRGAQRRLSRMLHLGASGPMRRWFTSRVGDGYVGADTIDVSPRSGGRLLEDPEHLSFETNSFDFVYCSHVLNCVNDDRLAIREIRRVLAPGGWALIVVPVDSELPRTREELVPRRGHHSYRLLRRYGRDAARRLRDSGFSVETIDAMSLASPEARLRMRLRDEDLLFVCQRRTTRRS